MATALTTQFPSMAVGAISASQFSVARQSHGCRGLVRSTEVDRPLRPVERPSRPVRGGSLRVYAAAIPGYGDGRIKDRSEKTKAKPALEQIEKALDAGSNDSNTDVLNTIITYGTGSIVAFVSARATIGVMEGINGMPIVPMAFKLLGMAVTAYFASKLFTKPQETIAEVTEALNALMASLEDMRTRTPDEAGEVARLRAAVKALQEERAQALRQVSEAEKATLQMAQLMEQKAALEMVAEQLARERDDAFLEVAALRTAVASMNASMANIEAMLASEVTELKNQNEALETVAMQLVAERDGSRLEMAELQRRLEEMWAARNSDVSMATMAAQLAEERDSAVNKLTQLQNLIHQMRENPSGLTDTMEAFVREKVREVRDAFIDPTTPYAQQREDAQRLVQHLAAEYGVPEDWASDYVRQYLQSSSRVNTLGVEGEGQGVPAPQEQEVGAGESSSGASTSS
eukprot:jgi/Mesvir1/21673/Mv04094-RA.1